MNGSQLEGVNGEVGHFGFGRRGIRRQEVYVFRRMNTHYCLISISRLRADVDMMRANQRSEVN